jgi:hypothetical protein
VKKLFCFLFVIFLCLTLASPVFAADDLGSFIKSLNVQAQADLGAFKIRLSTQFGVPVPRVEAIMASVRTPGDAYMCFRVGQVASQPVEVVAKEYQANKNRGVIAKNLGIKPGSKEFHALKKGDYNGHDSDSGKGKGRGKGKK